MLDPIEQTEANEPTLPIDSIDLSDHNDRTECEDPIDQRLVPDSEVIKRS